MSEEYCGHMSEENAEQVIREAHAAFRSGDVEAFVSCWSPVCEYEPVVGALGADHRYRDHEGIRRWWHEFAESWEDWRTHIHEIRRAGAEVLVEITVDVTGKGSGAEVAQSFFQVVAVRDGKIVRSRDFATREEALEAAGLPD
jgi:ketosteroid isomerase-like protein